MGGSYLVIRIDFVCTIYQLPPRIQKIRQKCQLILYFGKYINITLDLLMEMNNRVEFT